MKMKENGGRCENKSAKLREGSHVKGPHSASAVSIDKVSHRLNCHMTVV
jgi:hypothetical protein